MLIKPTIAAELNAATRRIPDDVLPDMSADLDTLRKDVERILGDAERRHEIRGKLDQARLSLGQLEQSLAQLRRAVTETATFYSNRK